MGEIILVTGGARSGKSRFAESRAERFGFPLLYLATATPHDREMEARIARHRMRRGGGWVTVESPREIEEILLSPPPHVRGILLDCLTLWITNLLFHHGEDPEPVIQRVRDLAELFPRVPVPLVIVTNEVGSGIVPETPLGRLFRDLAGEANQIVAKGADELHLVVCGVPLRIR
ncbi:MAG: bifunctional adenosylcobinamide kinase/adenosylcobinamide-phosphate guanylyltransferase [Desulfuromonadia bacterium]